MEPWIGKALLLTATFACAMVVLAYRDYALQRGWPVGDWVWHNISWDKILAAVTIVSFPLLGLLSGPWWLVLLVPVAGFFMALVATDILRGRIQPLALLGLAVGWPSSLIWLSIG